MDTGNGVVGDGLDANSLRKDGIAIGPTVLGPPSHLVRTRQETA